MNKSDFYKTWYVRHGQPLNEYGYPPVLWQALPITDETEWQAFLQMEPDPEDFVLYNEEAANHAGVPYTKPHKYARTYPALAEQLDGIYKALMAVKASGMDLGAEGNAYLDSITAIKTAHPKTPDWKVPDPSTLGATSTPDGGNGIAPAMPAAKVINPFPITNNPPA
jgi:hypothetical protein